MSIEKKVGYEVFPKQGAFLGKIVEVFFNYDVTRAFVGRVVRNDAEEPQLTIIKLKNGKYVTGEECRYWALEKRF